MPKYLSLSAILLFRAVSYAWVQPSPKATSSSTAGDVEAHTIYNASSPLSVSFEDLCLASGGSGRAKLLWEGYRSGNDLLTIDDGSVGDKARRKLQESFPSLLRIDSIASLIETHVSNDNTTKILIRMASDQLDVEAVIIPWTDRQSSTLCVSSQVGCQQACRFCQTGTMGLVRSLSADEILVQLVQAIRLCDETPGLYPIDNVVFMGMGEPADNIVNVVQAAKIMTDPRQFALVPRKVTISTVAPSPEAFERISEAPVVMAWSIHSAMDDKRGLLVPTARCSLDELRSGLLQALQQRSRRLRAIMLEVILLDDINDGADDANALADFCEPLLAHAKVVVNLIPWNPTTDIVSLPGPQPVELRTPHVKQVEAFQKALVARGLRCYVRTTRGDDERAACGQLSTVQKRETE